MISKDKPINDFEERDRLIWENFDDLIIVAEPMEDFKIEYINEDSFKHLLGYTNKDLMGKSFLNYIHSDDLIKYKDLYNKYAFDDQIREVRIIAKKGNYLWVDFKIKPFRNNKNQQKLFIFLREISKLKELELKLEKSEKRFEKITYFVPEIKELKLTEQRLRESEEKYRLISENANDLIFVFNEKFEYEYINENVHKRILGYTKNDLIGKNQLPYIHPDDRKQALIATGSILRKGKGSHSIRFKHKDGTYKWLEITGKNFVDSKGIKKTLAIARDITNRKKAEEKLKESEAKYHELFETSPDGVILTDIKGNILECNSALEKISDYTIDEFVGKNFRDLEIYHENALDILLEGYNDLFGNKILPYVEFPIKRKDNDISWVQLSSTLIDMKGEKFILVVIHNITSQKQAEEGLKKSEEKYRDLLETSSLGVIEIDVKNIKMTYINPKLLDIVGYSREELSEEIFRNDLIHEKDLAKLLRTNEEAEIEFRIIDKQGKEKWLSGKRIPHFNDKGEITSIRVWLDDITEKKLYENLIYELNINFLNFTANIQKNIELLLDTGLKLLNGDIILYIHEIKSDKQIRYQIITSENKIFTFDEKEFSENLFFNELFHEGHDFPQTFFDVHMKKYAKTDPFIKDYEIKGCFGKVIKSHNGFSSAVCVFYKENPIITGQEKLVMFLICDAIEIEQRRWQVQRDLEEQNITLNKINKLKTELFSRTSHELKTPLISIKGFTELLLTLHHSKFDPEVISILEEIKEGSKRLENIINLLLESTKLEAGQLELNPSEEDLIFLIKFCVKELRGLATLRDQSISLDLHQILNTKFDKERIYEVISNLIVNAIKYTPPGGHIQIKSEIKDSEFIISIQDNGIGFTEEEKNQAFKQFGKIERYGQGWDISTEGSGLGLYITKKLIELHGGKIWLESKGRNKGSTFYFSIPKK